MRNRLLIAQLAAFALAADSARRMASPEPQKFRVNDAPRPERVSPERYNPHEARNARRDQIRRNGGKR